MKKLLVLAILLFAIPACAAVQVTWTHDGADTVGYTVYFQQTQGQTVYNKSVAGPTVRQMILDEGYFVPGVEYTFRVYPYNAAGQAATSPTATWTREGSVYAPPSDSVPSTLFLKPSGVDSIVIQLTP